VRLQKTTLNTKNIKYEKNASWYGSHYDENDFNQKAINKGLLETFS